MQRFPLRSAVSRTVLFAIVSAILFYRPALTAENSIDDNLRIRCVNTLREEMLTGGHMYVKARAAEALLMNVYTDGVAAYFNSLEPERDADTALINYILALAHRKNAVAFNEHVNIIIDAFKTDDPFVKIITLDCLGRLGVAIGDPALIQTAEEKTPAGALALWVSANSGVHESETELAKLLSTDDSRTVSFAAYVLRKLPAIRQETYDTLVKSASTAVDKSASESIFLIGACFIHSPPDRAGYWKQKLLSFNDNNPRERVVIADALADRGEMSDIFVLERMLDDDRPLVRIAAANALLRIERRQFRGVSWPDWAVIVLYGAAMLGIGWYFSKRQKTSEDYLVGGRRVNSFVSGISMFASYLSTISYLAIAGEVIKHGPLVFLIHIASIIVVYPLTAYFLIPFFMKLPITSAYEIIGKPLGNGVRLTGSVIFLLTRFVWMALLIFLTSKALVVMLGWDERMIMYVSIAGGIITLIYSTIGGLRAVVTTDVTQFFILIFGALLTIILVTVNMGGAGAWIPTEWAPNWDRIVVFSLNPHIRLTVFFTVIHIISWWVSTAGSDQMAIQRFVSTKDVRAARHAFLFCQIGEKILFSILICVGFALLSFYRTNPHCIPDGKDLITDADFLFPNFIANYLPIGASGLVIAAIFSAAMSSLSSGINSTAAVITTDILPWVTGKTFDDHSKLRLAKWCSLVIGVLVITISSTMGKVPGNITEVTTKTNGLFVCPLFNLFFMALFIPFATPLGTIVGSVYGVASAFMIAFWDVLTGGPGVTFLWIGPVSLAVSITVSMLFSLIPSRGKSIAWQIGIGALLLIPVVALIWLTALL